MIRDPQRILIWVVNKIGGLTLGTIILLMVIFGSVIYGISDNVRGLEFNLLFPYVFVGLLFGWLLARSKLSGRSAAIIGLTTGIILVLLLIGGLISPIMVTVRAIPLTTIKAFNLQVDLAPLSVAGVELVSSSSAIFDRLYLWVSRIISGNPSFDNMAIAILWSLVIWCLAVWASWAVRRKNRPLLGVLPAGIVMTVTLNYVRADTTTLLPMTGGVLLLTALLHYFSQVHIWQSNHIDYSEDIRFDFYLITSFLTLAILSTSFLLPSISIRQISRWAANFSPINSQVEESVAESIGIQSGYSSDGLINTMIGGGLPRSHLIGSGPELSEEIVMLVKPTLSASIDQYVPLSDVIPRFYWRSFTYDVYTGSGWASSSFESATYSANEWTFNPLSYIGKADHSQPLLIRQQIQGIENLQGFLYAAGKLATVDADFRISWRPTSQETEGSYIDNTSDFFGATIETNTYQATSLVNAAGADQLRASGTEYPEWINDRYLELPPELPERVISLAHQITASESNPYDSAMAIESYLRDYPYTLDLPEPPTNRDIVDYFLFDLGRGYCDYYATSMVVLARAAEIPARMAIGFANGNYDPEREQYIVSQADAHSWPEIYFPDIGWVEFEPTAGQSLLNRPQDLSKVELPTFADDFTAQYEEPAKISPLPWPFWLIGVTILAFIAFSLLYLIDSWRLRHLPPRSSIYKLYKRFYRMSQRLNISSQKGDTPNQYAASLEKHFGETIKGGILSKYIEPTVMEASQLTDVYTLAQYSSQPPAKIDQRKAIQIWKSLRWRLSLARILRKV